MTKINSYQDLLVWQKSMDLTVRLYQFTDNWPKSEEFGLKSQVRRAATSIPANIAEGHGRDHLGDYLHHLSIAKGSLAEVETHLLLAARLGYMSENDTQGALASLDEISRMLSGLSSKLRVSRT